MAVKLSISITQNSQSVTNNTSNVTAKVVASWTGGSFNQLQKSGWLTIDGTKYTFTSNFNYDQTTSGSKTLFTKTVDVKHSSDGSKTLSCSASYTTGVSSGTITASASKVLTTIPRKSTLTTSNGTLGTSQTLKVTRQASSFTHTITYKCGSASGTVCTKSSSTSISWTPPLSLANQNTTGTTVSITFTITTYNGSTSLGSNTKTISCSMPDSIKPSCSIAISDSAGLYSLCGSYVKGLSKLKVVVTPTTSYGSAISSYKSTANGSTYTSATFTTDVLKSFGTLTVSSKVTDKRGRSGSNSAKISVIDYTVPVISKLSVKRCNEDGTENDQGEFVYILFSANVTSLSNKNTATYSLRYKKCSDDTYTTVNFDDYTGVYSIADVSCIIPADSSNSYDIELTASDSYNTTKRTTTASTGYTLMNWNVAGNGMGIGKVAELQDVLDIGMQTRFFGGILHLALEPETNLDDVRTPNTYFGDNVSANNYSSYYNGALNFPLMSGTFTLEVVGMGESGQVKQRLTYCHKTASRAWERIYYSSTWGDWVCVSDFDGQLLWEGGRYMTSDHTNNLAEPISKQRSGITLVFSEYIDGATSDTAFHTRFVPKTLVAKHPGKGHCFQLSSSNLDHFGTKYLYISDSTIVGHDNNGMTGTGDCGITFNNARFVLRYVIGV